jgi:hypothetical protein
MITNANMPQPHITLRKKDMFGNTIINERESQMASSTGFRRTAGASFGVERPATADPMAQTLQKWRESI